MHLDPGTAAAPAHVRHVPPRLAAAPRDVELVAPGERRRIPHVIDVADVVREHPCEDEQLVREGPGSAHCRDRPPPRVGIEVKRDPLHRRPVRVVAVEEAKANHGLLVVGVLAREQVVPTPELPAKDLLDALCVRLEGLRDALVSLAPSDAERAERKATFRPLRGGLGEACEHLLRDAPAFFAVGQPQSGKLDLNRQLEGVLFSAHRAPLC